MKNIKIDKSKKNYIITLDEGTTSARTLIVDRKGKIVSSAQLEFTQYTPNSGWVEQDAMEIWNTQLTTMVAAKRKAGLKSNDFAAMGITNQRETIVVWNKKTGLPVYNAIVWQDRRTSKYCDEISTPKNIEMIREKTGLIINPYFSATKLKWIIDNISEAKELISENSLLAGTIDTWLIWNLTKGKVHATDVSNASRTLLFNINTLKWDDELLNLFKIPKSILPEVKPSSGYYGDVDPKKFSNSATGIVPITGVAGDQQSALFGQMCHSVGDVKVTYGTGCFTLVNTGIQPVFSKNHLLTTIAWQIGKEKPIYALEGSVFIAGSVIKWLRDELRVMYRADESDYYASIANQSVNNRVYFVPAFSGLGAPYWDSEARGSIFGLEYGTKREHIIKAAVEAIAYQSNDLITAMSSDLNKKLRQIKADGGASNSNYLLQFQSSISNINVLRPKVTETTAMGATFLAGLSVGIWKSISELKEIAEVDQEFKPKHSKIENDKLLKGWKVAVSRSRNWIKDIN